jgi:hypothetical protein
MAFHPLEDEVISGFGAAREIGVEWRGSPLRDLVTAAPSTKGRFAREIVSRLAEAAGMPLSSIPGSAGSRRRVGTRVCEIKFSTEDPPRFQQVRPPGDAYDWLIGIGAHPHDLVYWCIPADEVQALIDQGAIAYQHANTSLWFFPSTVDEDEFSSYRTDAAGVVARFRTFG